MATAPEIIVAVRDVPATTIMEIRNPAVGEKPPWYLAAARRRQDRDYTPRYDIIEAS